MERETYYVLMGEEVPICVECLKLSVDSLPNITKRYEEP